MLCVAFLTVWLGDKKLKCFIHVNYPKRNVRLHKNNTDKHVLFTYTAD